MYDDSFYLVSDEIREFDEDDEDNPEIAHNASMDYDLYSIVNSIDTPEFKQVFLALYNDVENFTLEFHRKLCYKILDRIEEIFNYRFPENIEIVSKENAEEVYKFIRFVGFDYIDFFAKVWRKVDSSVNVLSITSSIGDVIMREVDNLARFDPPSRLSGIFLLTYDRISFLEFFIRKSTESKMLIKLRIMEGDLKNG